MRFTQNYYLIMNKEEELNNLQFDNDKLLHQEFMHNELINERNQEIIYQIKNEGELDEKIEKFQAQGVNVVTKEQLQEQKVEFIKATTNLMNYDIFKREHNMSQRKKEALRGLAGQVLIELALYHQTIYDVNNDMNLGINEGEINNGEQAEQGGEDDIEQNFNWQKKQQLIVHYDNQNKALFSTIRVIDRNTPHTPPHQRERVIIHRITFNELLNTCSKYWSVEPQYQVFIDNQRNICKYIYSIHLII